MCTNLKVINTKSAFFEATQLYGSRKFWREQFHLDLPYARNVSILPCGKCVECLKKKQDQFVVRFQEEAKKRGSLHFVTLTYNEESLPLAQSLWRVNLETGEMSLEQKPQLIYSASHDVRFDNVAVLDEVGKAQIRPSEDGCLIGSVFSERMKKVPTSHQPRFIDTDLFFGLDLDPGYKFISRITPTVWREDVRLWLKRCRVQYEREYGQKLPDFAYSIVSEYGFKTCRPHYHMLIAGLSCDQVNWMCDRWKLGMFLVESVPVINPDGSNAYSLAARYVSKYVTKGRFECQSVKDGCCQRPRLCQSRGIGASIMDRLTPYLCGFDIYGEYDLDSLELKDGTKLSSDQIKVLVEQIPKRLRYTPDGKYYYPIPRVFLDKCFKEKCVRMVDKYGHSASFGSLDPLYNEKIVHYKNLGYVQDRFVFRSRKIWSLVKANLFQLNADLYNQQLRQFLSSRNFREASEGLVAFRVYQDKNSFFADKIGEKKVLDLYSKSKC